MRQNNIIEIRARSTQKKWAVLNARKRRLEFCRRGRIVQFITLADLQRAIDTNEEVVYTDSDEQ